MSEARAAASGRGGLAGFVERTGGMLVAPASTLEAVQAGGPGGVRDLIWLLLLQVLAVQLPQLLVAVLTMFRQSYMTGMTLLVNTVAASAWMPLAAAIVGTVAIGPWTRGRGGAERTLDLCSLCALPAVALQLGASLLVGLSGARPGRWVAIAVLAAGGLWFLALMVVTVRMIRRNPPEPRR